MAEHVIYLTTGKNPKGDGLVAIASRGQPQLGDVTCSILAVEVVPDVEAAEKWFEKMRVERPWEARN